jgi:hypothetical protein
MRMTKCEREIYASESMKSEFMSCENFLHTFVELIENSRRYQIPLICDLITPSEILRLNKKFFIYEFSISRIYYGINLQHSL